MDPVATPSSTTTTVRPATGSGGRPSRSTSARRATSRIATCSTASYSCAADPGRADDGLVHDPGTLLADRAHGQLGLAGDADLADDHDVQRGVQGLCHAHRDGDAAAGQTQDDGIGQAQLAQPLTQQPSGLVPVGEDLTARARSRPHPVTVAASSAARQGLWSPPAPRRRVRR